MAAVRSWSFHQEQQLICVNVIIRPVTSTQILAALSAQGLTLITDAAQRRRHTR